MSLNKDTLVFKYKAYLVTLVEDKPDGKSINWESMGIENPNPEEKSKTIPGYEGMKIEKTKLVWKSKTFNKRDIVSIEEEGKNTLVDMGYKTFIIQPSFVEALEIIYKKQLVQTNK